MLYSVIIPVYNSQKTLVEICKRIIDTFENLSLSVELILVDDGSEDNSWNIIKELTIQYPNLITGIHLARNFGQHKALLCGMRHCQGDFTITIDDDLQHCPEDINLLISKQLETNADLVYGIFKSKKHSLIRNSGSKVLIKILHKYANTPENGSSFRLISRHVTDQMKNHHSPFVLIDELLAWYSRSHALAEVQHETRKEGKSGYSLIKLFSHALRIIFTLTVLPLRLITWFGLFAFIVCLILIAYFVYQKYTYGSQLGFTALIVSLFMSTGLILFSIGIIGEYISRLFILQTNKPPFIIKEIVK